VLAAAAELDYAGPDPLARSLRRGRSGVVGVVTEDTLADAFRDPINLALLDGIGEGFRAERFGLLVMPQAGPDGVDFASASMDAAILLGCSTDVRSSVEALRRRRIPVVAIEAEPYPGVVAIELDNRDASRRGAEWLRELGHRRVAVVTLPLDSARKRGPLTTRRERAATGFAASERLRGVRQVFPDATGVSAAGSTVEEGTIAGRALLADPATRPTAIVAQSDLLAAGVLLAARELSIRVPEQLSVVGFDGIRLDGITAHSLTTLVQPAIEKGQEAARAVREALAGQTPTGAQLTSKLRIGSTTAMAPA
jgi:DNA-binding LacI/PurR family transcriptional regulator